MQILLYHHLYFCPCCPLAQLCTICHCGLIHIEVLFHWIYFVCLYAIGPLESSLHFCHVCLVKKVTCLAVKYNRQQDCFQQHCIIWIHYTCSVRTHVLQDEIFTDMTSLFCPILINAPTYQNGAHFYTRILKPGANVSIDSSLSTFQPPTSINIIAITAGVQHIYLN